jgi:hypothetical protein
VSPALERGGARHDQRVQHRPGRGAVVNQRQLMNPCIAMMVRIN